MSALVNHAPHPVVISMYPGICFVYTANNSVNLLTLPVELLSHIQTNGIKISQHLHKSDHHKATFFAYSADIVEVPVRFVKLLLHFRCNMLA